MAESKALFDCKDKIKNRIYFILIFLGAFLVPVSCLAVTIEGRIFTGAGPLSGARVYVYKDYDDIRTGKSFLTSEATDEQGLYKVRLPEGEYYFTAKGTKDDKDYSAYHGANPISLKEEDIWLPLTAHELKTPAYSSGVASLRGVITYKGEPVKDAYIAIYSPEEKRFRGMGLRTEPAEDNGTFYLSVPPGRYVVIARKMRGDNRIQPLKNGDLFCYYPQNPVEVKPGKILNLEVPCSPKGEKAVSGKAPASRTDGRLTAGDLVGGGKFGIKGKITDSDGKGVRGAYIIAYKGRPSRNFITYQEVQHMEGIGESDEKGEYFVSLNSDGFYRFVARNKIGARPRGSELFTLYNGNPQHGIDFKRGQIIEGINMVVEGIDDGSVRGEPAEKRPGTVKRVSNAVFKTDQVIDSDTVWQGNILIDGLVWVKRGATLTIEPGAVIRFRKIHSSYGTEEGLNNSRLIVEGRIVARGDRGKRIIFTSGEEKPAVNDWSCILVFMSSDEENVFEHCEFHYANVVMHVLYSWMKVSDCVFTHNQEAIFYESSRLAIEHNNFSDNDVAIRFIKLDGKVFIGENLLADNNIGILFRHYEKEHDTKPEEEFFGAELPRIANNNIYNNRIFNFMVGENSRQADLGVSNNWWGSAKEEDIEKYVFDRRKDKAVGGIVYSPYLKEPMKGAGVRDGRT